MGKKSYNPEKRAWRGRSYRKGGKQVRSLRQQTCGYECMCDSLEKHEAAVEQSRLDFLRDPGPPPSRFSSDQMERAEG